jgi:hypothetical protein
MYEDDSHGALKPGERLLWHGQPQDKFDLRGVPFIALLMSWVGGVLFGGIGVALLYACLFTAPWRVEAWSVVLLLFGIVFLITGVYILLGPWLQRLVRRSTFYAVTDRRVIIINKRPWHRVVTLDLDRLASVEVLLEAADGSGDIELHFDWGTTAGFEFISNVREVAALMLMARTERVAEFGPAPARQWPPGILGQDAPKGVAWLSVLVLYLCVALYPALVWVDLKELSRMGLSAFAPPLAYSDHGIFSPASDFALAPIMMFFFYSRARKFKSEMRFMRYFDVMVAAIFAAFGGVLLSWEAGIVFDAGGRTGGYVILGVFALLLARGRAAQRAI